MGRLETARRGAELLERKRSALLREQAHVSGVAAETRATWQEAIAELTLWTSRAGMLDGAARLKLLARHVDGQASLQLSWSNLMGARLPVVEQIVVPDPPPLSALGGSSAAVTVARLSTEAIRAGVLHAVAERANAELSKELAQAARRLRALRDRWIPQHEEALARLNLALDESQREQAARVRWLTQRQDPKAS